MKRGRKQPAPRPGRELGSIGLVCAVVPIVLLLVSRRPDVVVRPQFWAEEGSLFFVQALERPFWANVSAHAYGYFDVFLRLAHTLAAAVPLRLAPAALIDIALVMQTAVALMLLSARMGALVAPLALRLLLALLYIGLPNSFEVHLIQLHSRAHLALLAMLLILVPAPARRMQRLLEGGMLVLAALSGPFVFVLTVSAGVLYLVKRRSHTRNQLLLLAGPCLLAVAALATSAAQRAQPVPLGAGLLELARIVGGHMIGGLFLGARGYARLLDSPVFDEVAITASLLLAVWLAWVVWRGTWEQRLLLFFGFAILTAGLISPLAAADRPQWLALWSIPLTGQRYYFFPAMAVVIVLVARVAEDGSWRRVAQAACLAFLLLVGVPGDWRLREFPDLRWERYAEAYTQLPPGRSLQVPINPPGWTMVLTKPEHP